MHLSILSLTAAALAGFASALSSSASDLDGSLWSRAPAQLRARFAREKAAQALALGKRQSDWDPPSDLEEALEEVWEHCESTYDDLYGFMNYGWDQLIANDGYLNMCVRWESTATVSEAERAQVATVVEQQYQKWFDWLYGFDNFPFTNITVNVVGWAVTDTSLLQGSTSGIDVYTDTDSGGAPQCAEACGRFFHQDGNYAGCSGGESSHYDQSLWLTDGFSGGAGGDWGQRIAREYFMDALDTENIHILLHEMGHTFGLDDFYDWTPTGQNSFIMLAGSAFEVTEFDGWMLRNWWYELSQYRGWQSSNAARSTVSQSEVPTTTAQVYSSAAPVETEILTSGIDSSGTSAALTSSLTSDAEEIETESPESEPALNLPTDAESTAQPTHTFGGGNMTRTRTRGLATETSSARPHCKRSRAGKRGGA